MLLYCIKDYYLINIYLFILLLKTLAVAIWFIPKKDTENYKKNKKIHGICMKIVFLIVFFISIEKNLEETIHNFIND